MSYESILVNLYILSRYKNIPYSDTIDRSQTFFIKRAQIQHNIIRFKMKFLLLSLVLLCYAHTEAQVTIGCGLPPLDGALLDLKENDHEGANSFKGMILPRVKLVSSTALYPMFISETDTLNQEYKDIHTGLTVYHISENPRPECDNLPSGVYVWNGSNWDYLFEKQEFDTTSLESYDQSTGILTDRNGFTYKTAEFGSAGRWMVENLRTIEPPTCEDIYIYEGETSLDKRQYYYPGGNITSSGESHTPKTWTESQGLLYNWAAATDLKNHSTSDQMQQSVVISANEVETEFESPIGAENGIIQGICPKGWHLPSDREWNELEKEIANNPSKYSMSTSLSPWNDSWATLPLVVRGTHGIAMISSGSLIAGYGGGTSKQASDNGFDVLLVGTVEGNFSYGFGAYAYYWTSSSTSFDKAVHRYVVSPDEKDSDPGVFRTSLNKYNLLSVRCKQN